MIDIHSHILWGLDDGARDLHESMAMLKIAAETGTTDIVATPHSDQQFKFDPLLVAERIRELSAATANVPRIHAGCDFHLSFDNVENALRDPSTFTINGLNYLMLEFADHVIPPSTEEIIRRLMGAGVIPIVTHPERNLILRDSLDRLQRWTATGCLLQVTAQCLTDRFGKAARQAAWKMLREGMVHVIASDAHDTEHRPPRLDIAREILTREMGVDAADLLLAHNPGAIIRGQKVEMAAPRARKKKWFFFG
jgi:protein-tyrosine phosphatase